MQRNDLGRDDRVEDGGSARLTSMRVGQLPATWEAIRNRFGTLFLFNFFVVMMVLTLALGIVSATYVEYVQRPRTRMAAELYGANVAALVGAIQSLPVQQRDAVIDGMARRSGGQIAADDPDVWGLVEPKQLLVQEFFALVRERLQAYSIAFTPALGDRDSALFWIAIPVEQGRTRWVRMDLPSFVPIPPVNVVLSLLLVIVTASAGTAYLITGTRRKLAWVAQALDGFDARSGRMSGVPPAQPQDDMLELSTRFQQMSTRLFEAQAERTLLMTGVARDLDALLLRLREVQPRATTPPEALRCIDGLQRVVQQFHDFAQADPHEAAKPLDLNPLLTELAMQVHTVATPIHLDLDGLPYTDLRESAARRIFGNLLGNAVLHAGRGIEMRSSLEDGWIVVRVLDRGPGLSDPELALVGRPFYRTDAARQKGPGSGLGIAIARQQAEAHGGSLRVTRRPGGGLQVEVWLRLSTSMGESD